MEQNFNRRIETDLDLNGPHLVISSHPSDATVSDGATQTFSVTASATFPGNTGADDEGTLTYQWYEDDEGVIKKLEKPKGFIARKLSSSLDSQIDSIANAIEERALWQKFGL